jgi:hypothetical protein
MTMDPGDHACVIYSTRTELVRAVAAYLTDGLCRREQCWCDVLDGTLTVHPIAGVDVSRERTRFIVPIRLRIFARRVRAMSPGN